MARPVIRELKEATPMTPRYALFCVTVASVTLLPAAAVTMQNVEPGFTSLFNGKDLTGWVYGRRGTGENKSGKGYQVENGIIYSTTEDGGNLYTVKEYSDFVLRFDVRLTENANNGIGIRAPLEGDAAYVGMEIQVLDDSGSQYTSLRPYQYHGSIYGMVAPKRGFQKPVGEWNSEEITAKGRQITVKLNGTTIVDANLDDVKDEEMLKTHRDLSKPEGSRGIANTKGHIGFLGHGARVEFRNIRIKEL
jgi:3-keto-disaccharide hydrolase